MNVNKRNIAACLLSGWYILTGRVKKVKERAARGEILLSVYFHSPSKQLFENCVRWFINNGFTIITVEELDAVARGEKPFPSLAVVLTADDGWRSNKENIAEVANRYKVPITIFASTKPIETGEAYWWSYIAEANKRGIVSQSVSALKKVPNNERLSFVETAREQIELPREALTVDELATISKTDFVQIGSHTVTHPILTTCSDDTAAFEITESRKILQNWLSADIPYFAYPNGAFNQREINLLQHAGYRMAFSTEQAYVTPENLKHIYKVPRFDVLEDVSFTENICRMTGVWFNR